MDDFSNPKHPLKLEEFLDKFTYSRFFKNYINKIQRFDIKFYFDEGFMNSLDKLRTQIIKYKTNDNPNQADLIKLDSMSAVITLMIDFCSHIVKPGTIFEDFDINKMKDLLQAYLKYPHRNFLSLHCLFLMFTKTNHLKTSNVLFDLTVFDMKEVEKQKLNMKSGPADGNDKIYNMNSIILQNESYYLFRLFFKILNFMKSSSANEKLCSFDIKASSILKELRTNAMKNSLPDSVTNYEEAVNVAKLLLAKNREIFEKEGREKCPYITSQVPFLEHTIIRVYEPSMLAAMTYAYLPFYVTNSKMQRKLANHAYGLWMDYYKNLPADAHHIHKIETLKFMMLSFEVSVTSDNSYDTLKNTFKYRNELLSLIKNNKLEYMYSDTFYVVCTSFRKLISIEDPEVNQGCEMFAEFIKTNNIAAEEFKKEIGKEFDESKVTIEELLEMMSETKI